MARQVSNFSWTHSKNVEALFAFMMTTEIQNKTTESQMDMKWQSILGIEQIYRNRDATYKKRMFEFYGDSSRLPVEVTYKSLFFLVLTDPIIIFYSAAI